MKYLNSQEGLMIKNMNIIDEYKKYFPEFSKVRPLKSIQEKAINNIIEDGNTLCIMPTGGGKSLVYWLAGCILSGITIVVSPLKALIDEQVEKLKALNISAVAIHGDISAKKQMELLKNIANKLVTPKFIFVSPERLATDGFFEYCIKQRQKEVRLFVIDEVHCVSQWGLSFRPFYRDITAFIDYVFDAKPKILALTATLNPREVDDILAEFDIKRENIIKDQTLMRSEIQLSIFKFDKEDRKENQLWQLLKVHGKEKILVYVYRKYNNRGVEELSILANQKGFKSMPFHGDMSSVQRSEIIEKFKNDEVNIVFATNAFGMGIDIPDIRTVIHFMIPESIEQYYQEIGRAARDGKPANAYLLYSDKNIKIKGSSFIDNSFPCRDKLIEVYNKYFADKEIASIPYFDDEALQMCLQYFVKCGAIDIIAKGFAELVPMRNVKSPQLRKIIDSTKIKSLVAASKKTNTNIVEVINLVYHCLVSGEAEADKLDKRIIARVNSKKLTDEQLSTIESIIVERKTYRHGLLDFFVQKIEITSSSNELHQEIGKYLGVDKDKLNLIYSTERGDKVRSKSEVIIANLLFNHGINYEYERPLKIGSIVIRPDFTIMTSDNKTYYWEHLGMLNLEKHDDDWINKLKLYDLYYAGHLIITYESTGLSDSVLEHIDKLKHL